MIRILIELIFPPKLGKILYADLDYILIRHSLESGKIKPIDPGPEESAILGVFEWPNGRWGKPRRIR
jgi:hypothetical protein